MDSTTRLPASRLLIVDDLDENLAARERVLRRDGLEIVTVGSGAAALQQLLALDFALAIIDVQSPEMDGFALAERMGEHERTRDVPILFVTAGPHELPRQSRSYVAGAVDFLSEPIEPRTLRNKVETFLLLSRQRQQLAQQGALLREQQRIAEASDRAKNEFLANVSHEIRTPMNAIIGMTELALDTPLRDGQRQLLETARSAAEDLLDTIDDLLDFSKIEAGELSLDATEFSLRAAVGDTLRALASRAHRKALELVCDIRPAVPDALLGDAGRLRQVLINLVGNAIKFTELGEVVVDIDTAAVLEPWVRLRVSVQDTGIGISHEKQAAIFRAFEQADTSTTRRYGGTGLGLTIATRLIALMEGELHVESEPGRGSTFTFTAELKRQPGTQEPTPRSQLGALRVLIVDDNAVHLQRLDAWLREWGLAPCAVLEGGAALAQLSAAAASTRPFDLVLLDADVRGPDGSPLAENIRARAELWAVQLVLLTITARATATDRDRELQVRVRLPKPVLRDELHEALLRVATGAAAEHARRHGEPSGTRSAAPVVDGGAVAPIAVASSLRILVAEDHPFNADYLQQLLERRGHRVELASTGLDALRRTERESFDLLLLDLHMPELDGFQVIERLRARERGSGGHLPVIAVTARSRDQDRARCLAAGMDGFLTKPISADGLWAAVARVAPVESDGRGYGAAAPMQRESTDLLAPDVILAACGSDATLLTKLCDTLVTRLPNDMRELESALAEGDATLLRERAHKLNAMLATFSTEAGEHASAIEDCAAAGRPEDCGPPVARLRSLADELIRQVEHVSIETLRRATST